MSTVLVFIKINISKFISDKTGKNKVRHYFKNGEMLKFYKYS